MNARRHQDVTSRVAESVRIRPCFPGARPRRSLRIFSTSAQRRRNAQVQSHRAGFALLVVLLVVALLALSAYTFSDLMTTENQSAQLAGRQLQARALVDSGASHVRYFLELDELTRQDLGGLYHNPQSFQAQLVIDDAGPAGRGRFTVVAPEQDSLGYWGGWRFGLEDESGRLNINALNLDAGDVMGDLAGGGPAIGSGDNSGGTGGGGGSSDDRGGGGGAGDEGSSGGSADRGGGEQSETASLMDLSGEELLMKLPGMTIDVADAILDWIDEDDEPREYGAEIEYYSSLDPPYSPRNGPIESIEELLLVRGLTPDLLFGRDINRNGMVDWHEQQLPLYIEGDPGDGSMDRGWSAYLTLYSMEKNVDSEGNPRINLMGDDLQTLYDDLSLVLEPAWVTFIVAYRQSGPYEENDEGDEGGEEARRRGRRWRRRPGRRRRGSGTRNRAGWNPIAGSDRQPE